MLLPPEDICLQRIRSRQGHGFSDPHVARHMHRGFTATAGSKLCVVRSTGTPEMIATTITGLLERDALRIHVASEP